VQTHSGGVEERVRDRRRHGRDRLFASTLRQLVGDVDHDRRLRFTAPLPSGSRVRLHAKLNGTERRSNGVLSRIGVEVEIEGHDRPALVGEILFLAYG